MDTVAPAKPVETDTPPSLDLSDLESGGLNEAFVLVYKIMAILIVLLMALLFVLSVIDIWRALKNDAFQKILFTMNRDLMNKDTTEMESMQYLRNDDKNEPYSVFLEQKIVSMTYIIVGITAIGVSIQIAAYVAMKIFSVIRRTPFEEKIDLPMRNLFVVVVGFAAATLIESHYKKSFIKEVQSKMATTTQRMRTLKTYIYSNLTYANDKDFLPALTSDDLDKAVMSIKKLLATTPPTTGELSANDMLAVRLLFTINLYTYFRYEIPESDAAYQDLMAMFTNEGVKGQKVDPTMYLYYKRPIYVPNVYPSIRDQVSALLGDRERAFVKEISRRMRELNRQLAVVRNISSGKQAMKGYFWAIFFIALVAVAVLMGTYRKEVEPYWIMVQDTTKWVIEKLKSVILNNFLALKVGFVMV